MESLIRRTQHSDSILIIELNRPESLNALNRQVLMELHSVLAEATRDQSLRAIVFTGAGDKAFCAGADLKERKDMTLEETRAFVALIGTTFSQIAALPMATVAAINGVAFGGGLELALACDLRVFEQGKEVGLTECALGIIPGAGGTQRLPRLVGVAKAKELILAARRVGSEEALSLGLVNRVAKEGQKALEVALGLAEQIAKCAPLSVRAAKHAIDQGASLSLAEGLALEAEAYESIVTTKDRLEGLAAFAEKRAPNYVGL